MKGKEEQDSSCGRLHNSADDLRRAAYGRAMPDVAWGRQQHAEYESQM
jgi:hypothetical protein